MTSFLIDIADDAAQVALSNGHQIAIADDSALVAVADDAASVAIADDAAGVAIDDATINVAIADDSFTILIDGPIVDTGGTTINSGGLVATLADGAASSGQKILDVDNAGSFLESMYLEYVTTSGGPEKNQIDTISTNEITLDVNIGTNVGDNALVTGISTSAYLSAADYDSMADRFDATILHATADTITATDTTIDIKATADMRIGGFVAVDPFSADCEIRKITGVSGTTITVASQLAAHNDDTLILYMNRPMRSPEMYGGTGATALQADIDDASDKDVIDMPGTAYTIASGVTIDKKVLWRGGMDTTITLAQTEAIKVGVSEVRIERLKFSGSNVQFFDTITTPGDTAQDYTTWSFDRCVFDGVGLHFAKLGALDYTGGATTTGNDLSTDIVLRDCEVKNFTHATTTGAVMFKGNARVLVENCHIHDNGFDTNYGDGLKFSRGSNQIIINNCRVRNNTRDGIDLYDSYRWRVSNCLLNNNGVDGFETKWRNTDANDTHYGTIINCEARDNAIDGFDISAERMKIIGCSAVGNVTGIRVNQDIVANEETNACIITGNYAADNDESGIRCKASQASIVGNVCFNNNRDSVANGSGIYVEDGTDYAVTGNVCFDSQGTQTQTFGIFLDSITYGIVSGNAVRNNKTAGIRWSGITNVKIIDNFGNSAKGKTASSGDTTPTAGVQDGWLLITNAGATTITDFDDGYDGDIITVEFTNANTTLTDGTNIYLSGSANYNPPANTIMQFLRRGNKWYELSRSNN